MAVWGGDGDIPLAWRLVEGWTCLDVWRSLPLWQIEGLFSPVARRLARLTDREDVVVITVVPVACVGCLCVGALSHLRCRTTTCPPLLHHLQMTLITSHPYWKVRWLYVTPSFPVDFSWCIPSYRRLCVASSVSRVSAGCVFSGLRSATNRIMYLMLYFVATVRIGMRRAGHQRGPHRHESQAGDEPVRLHCTDVCGRGRHERARRVLLGTRLLPVALWEVPVWRHLRSGHHRLRIDLRRAEPHVGGRHRLVSMHIGGGLRAAPHGRTLHLHARAACQVR